MSGHSTILITLWICIWCCAVSRGGDQVTSKATRHTHQQPALQKHELYQDFFPLTFENFSSTVDSSEKIWLVVIHRGFLDIKVKREAVLLRGVVRFAMLSREKEKHLLQELDVGQDTVARVYHTDPADPYTKRQHRDFTRINEAIDFAKFCVDNTFEEFEKLQWEDLIENSYLSIPSRFPGILLLEPQFNSPSNLALRAVASQMRNYFHFAQVSNAVSSTINEKLKEFATEKDLSSPGMFVLLAENWKNSTNEDGKLKFVAIRFDKRTHGAVNYPKAMSFLLAINAQYRQTLPGENFANDPDVVFSRDVIALESDLFDISGDLEKSPGSVQDDGSTSNSQSEFNKSTNQHETGRVEL